MADAAQQFGVHPQTLRAWDRAGKITSYRVGELGWRRFDAQSIAAHMGLEVEQEKKGNVATVAIYCRVSSESQDKQGNLKRQVDRLRTEVAAREGISPRRVLVYRDVASSYGDRSGLNQLVEDVIGGKVARVYCEYADRLSRVPSLTRLVESLCRNRGVDIVVLNKEETEDIVQQAMMELIKFAQVIGCKISGKRGADATRRTLSSDQLRQSYLWKKEGMSWKGIAREVEKRGWKDEQGRKLRGNAARQLISRRVTSQWSVLESSYGKHASATNSFDEFVERYITISDSDRQLMPRGKVAAAYSAWCEANGKLEVAPSTISKVATKRGWKRRMQGKHVLYVGVSLNINQKNKRRKAD
ncbi:MAG: recombinase family protein [Pirellulales bacterium]|nr:recombinase family protein [Pirellulales bacterium]